MSVETEAYIIILKKWLAVTDHVNYLRMEIVHQWTIWKENTSRYSVVNTDARWQGTSELQGYHRRWWYLLHLLKEAKTLLACFGRQPANLVAYYPWPRFMLLCVLSVIYTGNGDRNQASSLPLKISIHSPTSWPYFISSARWYHQ